MKIVLTALALAIASPALAQPADPHASHKAAPAAPAHADHCGGKKDCCASEQKDCCEGVESKSCCSDKAKSGNEAHAGHQSH